MAEKPIDLIQHNLPENFPFLIGEKVKAEVLNAVISGQWGNFNSLCTMLQTHWPLNPSYVHIGPDEPTDPNVVIWINLNELGQTYDETSLKNFLTDKINENFNGIFETSLTNLFNSGIASKFAAWVNNPANIAPITEASLTAATTYFNNQLASSVIADEVAAQVGAAINPVLLWQNDGADNISDGSPTWARARKGGVRDAELNLSQSLDNFKYLLITSRFWGWRTTLIDLSRCRVDQDAFCVTTNNLPDTPVGHPTVAANPSRVISEIVVQRLTATSLKIIGVATNQNYGLPGTDGLRRKDPYVSDGVVREPESDLYLWSIYGVYPNA